uniref:NBS-LRR disease resistance protein n=1 Tax=Dasypyrum villosum TaxID=40247 RepID=A0A8K1IAV0_9POAL|nr:NBS-LRR disease resistance protein [Dasypyrum villosum]
MEVAIGAASWLIDHVLNQLSNEFIQAYVDSSELGLNAKKVKDDLMFTQGLLHEAQRRGMSDNPGLKGLVQQLRAKADAAEDALDELHYFIIQDQLCGTKYAEPDLGDGLRGHARHGRHAARYTVGNWLNCFSCSRMQDDGAASTDAASKSHNTTNVDSSNDGPFDKLPFDRVAMSKKIKSVIEEIHSLCDPVSKLLTITTHQSNTASVNLNRPLMGSTLLQDKLYGRSVIFEQTIKDITTGTYLGETLSVLPIVGPGGIGKTTLTQHLYNDKRTEEHFTVRVWVCVSTDFDVLKLTQQIHSCIPAAEKGEMNTADGTTNLDQLQKSIANRLKSKRFLIVLDDIWKCDSDEWNSLLAPFTKGGAKGSMVLVTTRFPKIEEMVKKGTSPINLQGLDPHEFFVFFRACVFGENEPSQEYNELADTGNQIARKLKCSPLAAKTVARLLKKHLSWEHWRKVLENNEWQNETNKDDIMPALKISYDYLPFHLKQCFSYFCLFPEDHRFKAVDINRFWTALGIIDSSCKNKNYLEELVDSGFLMKEDNNLEDPCYVMHDLLHELSQSVSSQECANISSSGFSADKISPSTRHLAITIGDKYNKNFGQEMAKLKSRIHINHLRTLMIFGGYDKRIVYILKDTFSEIEDIRVLFIVMKTTDSLPKNFSKLLHLRYLQIRSSPYCVVDLPSTLSRFYHLIFLDLQDWAGNSNLPKYFTHLMNLRHFIASHELHSNVPEVGKIEHLEELKAFHVKKESVGFELEELGKLKELGGELSIYDLHKVATKGEANEANLALKRNLKSLGLFWDPDDSNWVTNSDDDVGDGFQPHDNLRELTIGAHGGAAPPSWLCRDIPMRYLELLTLMRVSWCTLPPFGELPYLKRLELCNIDRILLIEPDYGTSRKQTLETIECFDCPNLLSLSFFPECSVSCTQGIHCPSLRKVRIDGCPKLFVSPIPPAPAMNGYSGALAFHNLVTPLTELSLFNCDILTVDVLNLLSTIRGSVSEVARRTKQLPAGSFQLEKLHVDSISSVLVAALCSHLSATLLTLTISSDQRVESLTAEEEEALQLLTSLKTLYFQCCPGLPSLPQGLHSISSLSILKVHDCPEIRSLPKMGLPSSLGWIEIKECSAELHQEVMKLKRTNLRLTVDAKPKASQHKYSHSNFSEDDYPSILSVYSSEDETSPHTKSILPVSTWENQFLLFSLLLEDYSSVYDFIHGAKPLWL